MEYGLNLWDAAAVYGEGTLERILGNFVKDADCKDVILPTKFTPQIADDSPSAMQEMIDGRKKRLYTDVVDIYWIHNPMAVESWTPDLIPLAKSRQIKKIGVSNHNLTEIKQANEILASPAQVATAWAIAKGTLPIIGVTKARQIEEASDAAQICLTEEEVGRLEKLGDETGVHTLREWEKEM